MTLDEIKQYKLETEIERLREQIASLQAVLENIADNSDDEWAFQEARRALEPKP